MIVINLHFHTFINDPLNSKDFLVWGIIIIIYLIKVLNYLVIKQLLFI